MFIDFSQASPLRARISKELLERDVQNLVRFFGERGVELDAQKVLETIQTSDKLK